MKLLWPRLFATMLAFSLPAAASAQVRDEAKLFKEDTVKKVNDDLAALKGRTGKSVVIETHAEIPAQRKKDYRPEERNQFFEKWAKERLAELKLDGVLMLICKEPQHLRIVMAPELEKKGFTVTDRAAVLKILLERFKQRKFDDGLIEGVKLTGATLEKTFKVLEIKDDGGFFSADAVKRGNALLAEFRQKYGQEVLIETARGIPEDRKKDLERLGRAEFFAQWARDRLRTSGASICVLVSRDPTYLQVSMSEATAKKAFTGRDRDEARDVLLKHFRQREFDRGLSELLAVIERSLKKNLEK